jgi:hypothetical protein
MFGFGVQAKAVKAATAGCFDILSVRDLAGGRPPGFWRDPYVLGFFFGAMCVQAKTSSQGRLSGVGLARVASQTFENIAGPGGAQTARTASEFAAMKHPEFLQGTDDASRALLTIYGSREFDEFPDLYQCVIDKIDARFA